MPEKVYLYALSTCGHCKRAKQFLEDHNIAYEFVYVDKCVGDERKHVIEDIKKHNPACTFPTLLIDGVVVVGYKEKEIMKALGL